MKEIYRTTDLGEIALLKSVFQSEGIEIVLFDEFTSQVMGGVMGAYAPCRIMLLNDDDYENACALLAMVNMEPSA